MEAVNVSLIDWSRAQFALTACYHWLFVPLTLGLGLVMAIMETLYVRTGNEFWKRTVKFWMNLFAVNFAIGVATGLILEFQFGANWSNYSWFVGDIFGAPLAIEGILAFFMEATFFAVMFFGWNKVSKRAHLISTWMVWLGVTISAFWILVANAWMQYPAGMHFNPDTVRHEMTNFSEVISGVAVAKFIHTVTSSWMLGGAFVVGVSCWYLWKKRDTQFARSSIRVGAWVGLVGIVAAVVTGHTSAQYVAKHQPMKLAAMEALFEGGEQVPIVAVGVLKPDANNYMDKSGSPFLLKMELPGILSWLAHGDVSAEVQGINQLITGGTAQPAMTQRIAEGKAAIEALGAYRSAKAAGDSAAMTTARTTLEQNFANFGYGYLTQPEAAVPPIALTFYSFHIMVLLGCAFLLFFPLCLIWGRRESFLKQRWLFLVAMVCVPLAYLTGMAGWIVAEVGRQPWTIQDLLPVQAAISAVSAGAVQTTFFIFLVIFTVLLVAEIGIMCNVIRKGPSMGN